MAYLKRIPAFVILTFRQHVLERFKSPMLLLPVVLTWAIAALPNPLGTSSLFWLANDWYYAETCLFLGLLSTTWLWVSLVVDTGKPWLTRPAPFYLGRNIPILKTTKWPSLPPDFPRAVVFCYLFVSVVILSLLFASAHVFHIWRVDLPARHASLNHAFLVSSGLILLGACMGIILLWIFSRMQNKIGFISRHVEIDILKIQKRGAEFDMELIRDYVDDEDLKKIEHRMANPDIPAYVWLHQTAALAAAVGVTFIVFAMTLPSWLLGWQWGSAAVHFCVLMLVLTLVVGFAVYRRRTGGAWFGLLFVATLSVFFFVLINPDHPIRGVTVGDKTLTTVISDPKISRPPNENRLDVASEITQAESSGNSPMKKRPLVVVAVSGGGIRAQIWALASLCALDEKLPGFAHDTVLVTGASGGMVGAAYFVASMAEPNARNPTDHYGQLINNSARDALTATFRTLILNDLLGAPARKLLPWFDIVDRGRVLEDEWIRHTGGESSVFARALSSFAGSERSLNLETKTKRSQGWRPVLLFAPVISEDGRRLIICNQRIDTLVSNQIRIDRDPNNNRLLSVDSLHLNDIDPNHQMTLATAARLNANFPFVVASPVLASPGHDQNGKRLDPVHIMDGGYYDNFGINLAARWLNAAGEFLIKENYSGILLIQISANNRNRLTIGGLPSKLPEAGYIRTGFQKTTFLTDFQIQEVSSTLNANEADFFRFCSLEFAGPVSLNWSLTASELYALLQPYRQMEDPLFDDSKLPASLREELNEGETIYDERFRQQPSKRLRNTIVRINRQFKDLQAWWNERSQ